MGLPDRVADMGADAILCARRDNVSLLHFLLLLLQQIYPPVGTIASKPLFDYWSLRACTRRHHLANFAQVVGVAAYYGAGTACVAAASGGYLAGEFFVGFHACHQCILKLTHIHHTRIRAMKSRHARHVQAHLFRHAHVVDRGGAALDGVVAGEAVSGEEHG